MIRCEGLRENNLKNITVSFPKNEITSVVGVSGSGKSSFAFDSVYAESQRIFFALMFPQASEMRLKCPHPDLDRITPILPAVSMKQAKNNFNPRSTIGTYTGITNILRSFFSAALKKTGGNTIPPAMLSPNTTIGACPKCKGLGYIATIDSNEIVDELRSIETGAIKIWKHKSNLDYYQQLLMAVCNKFDINTTIPLSQVEKEKLKLLFAPKDKSIVKIDYHTIKGGKRSKKVTFSGVLYELETYAQKHTTSEILSGGFQKYFAKTICPCCGGKRVRSETEQWKLCGLDFASVELLSLNQLIAWMSHVSNKCNLPMSLKNVIDTLYSRIESLERCELDYLCLARSIPSLSGGEYQRLRLSLALSTELSNMLFIFDEPSAGLHPQNIEHILSLMQELKSHNNTVLVVEHNSSIIKNSDYVIEIGPAAGEHGGYVTFSGTAKRFLAESSVCDEKNRTPLIVEQKHLSATEWIQIRDLKKNNVHIENLTVPLKNLITIVGVSGSGKSSLLQAIWEQLNAMGKGGNVCALSQKPIGKNVRSTVATYLGIFDDIRQLFVNANINAPPQIFSYNSKIGQCSNCKGTGVQSFDFMPVENIVCPECFGSRYCKEIENYFFHGQTISNVMNMSVDTALDFFDTVPGITKKLTPLHEIGLGYIHIGQSSDSLSGGESQRVKLGKTLQKTSHDGMYYLLDEPTAGLHSQDIVRLLDVFKKLKNQGATILIAEHTTQLIRASDYIIEIGNGGGEAGGKIIAKGSLSQIKSSNFSIIAKFL